MSGSSSVFMCSRSSMLLSVERCGWRNIIAVKVRITLLCNWPAFFHETRSHHVIYYFLHSLSQHNTAICRWFSIPLHSFPASSSEFHGEPWHERDVSTTNKMISTSHFGFHLSFFFDIASPPPPWQGTTWQRQRMWRKEILVSYYSLFFSLSCVTCFRVFCSSACKSLHIFSKRAFLCFPGKVVIVGDQEYSCDSLVHNSVLMMTVTLNKLVTKLLL